MSASLSRASRSRVARILTCAPALVALAACYHRSSAVEEPLPLERPAVGLGQRSSHDLIPRRFPGVDVIRTRGGGFLVQVHSGLVGAGEPLYLIDGAPVMVDPNRGIDWMTLDDVVQIRVHKDPSETTVYGPRGVSGVILITTKQGSRARTPGARRR
jgi:TonB-dependent SusC/RagA subfamily outer membrane receptor